MVSLVYELRENDINGAVIEKVEFAKPFKFIYGTGKLLQSFESAIDNLSPGDKFQFTLAPAKAYGEKKEELIIDVPKSIFEIDGKIDENICRVGNEIPMTGGSGEEFYGTISEIKENSVTMDFNHPMAGVGLCFTGSILEVREPSDEELEEAYGSFPQ